MTYKLDESTLTWMENPTLSSCSWLNLQLFDQGLLHGSVLDLVLFLYFSINDYIFRGYKLGRVAATLEDTIRIQINLYKLEKWSERN